jgi:hypothetical protein
MIERKFAIRGIEKSKRYMGGPSPPEAKQGAKGRRKWTQNLTPCKPPLPKQPKPSLGPKFTI